MEVVQCDECGFTQAVESERFAENEGWKFAPSAFEVNDGTKCPACVINQLKAFDSYSYAEPDMLLATVKAIASGDYQDPETLISLARECLDVIND
jgi:hypothetical protein